MWEVPTLTLQTSLQVLYVSNIFDIVLLAEISHVSIPPALEHGDGILLTNHK